MHNQGRSRKFGTWQEPAVQPETTVGSACGVPRDMQSMRDRSSPPAQRQRLGILSPKRWGDSDKSRRRKRRLRLAGFPDHRRWTLSKPRRCPPGCRGAWSDVSRHLLTGHSIPDMTAATRLLKKLRRHEGDPCLYIYPFSIPCLAVHFTIVLALRGKLRPSRELSHLGYHLVNIEKHDNLREWYLVEVNALGRVSCFVLKLRIGGT